MVPLNILVIPGSAREGSLNRKLAAFAADQARAAGLGVNEMDLRKLDLPIYDGDLEATSGIPAGAQQLQQAIVTCDAVLVVTPEYNGFPTPLVINAFDWLSRILVTPALPAGLTVTANKPVGLLSASPGPGGALRSMNFMRQYLQMAFAMIVVPQQFALGKAHEAFDEVGGLKDARAAQSVGTVLSALTRLAQALKTNK
jgi:NAD(P)H-dependent FMN reductase